MARRKLSIGLDGVVAELGRVDDDERTQRVLDAAEALLRERGLRGWTVDDVADRAGAGRMTVYRRFDGRDALVHAVLARELRHTIALIGAVAAGQHDLESAVTEGALVALRALDGSLVDHLLRSDPATFLPFLTTEAGPLIAIARSALASYVVSAGIALDRDAAEEMAETAARLGLSLVLTRDTVLPLGDDAALEAVADASARTARRCTHVIVSA